MVSLMVSMFCFFFFKQKTAYEMRISDWSSDVCSSDLQRGADPGRRPRQREGELHRVERRPGEVPIGAPGRRRWHVHDVFWRLHGAKDTGGLQPGAGDLGLGAVAVRLSLLIAAVIRMPRSKSLTARMTATEQPQAAFPAPTPPPPHPPPLQPHKKPDNTPLRQELSSDGQHR